MANFWHARIVRKGAKSITTWREKNPDKPLNLFRANLSEANLDFADLRGAVLAEADLSEAYLCGADLRDAILVRANLALARLSNANLGHADLGFCHLYASNMNGCDLHDADLRKAELRYTHLDGADLTRASFHYSSLLETYMPNARLCGASFDRTIIAATNLADVKGLAEVIHDGPSTIGVDTLVRSKGKIPDAFLRGCGFQPWQILEAKLYNPDRNSSAACNGSGW